MDIGAHGLCWPSTTQTLTYNIGFEVSMRWTAHELAETVNGELLQAGQQLVETVSCKTPVQNSLFVPLTREAEAPEEIAWVIEGGVSAVLISDRTQQPSFDLAAAHGVTLVRVDAPVEALYRLARVCARRITRARIAITGSNGKTSTRAMTGTVLKAAFHPVVQTQHNFNGHVGLSLCLLNKPHDPEVAVMELGTMAPGEVRFSTSILAPTIAVVTSLGLEHLKHFHNLQNIAKAETEAFALLPESKDSLIVIPAGEPLLEAELPAGFRGRVMRIGESTTDDVQVSCGLTGERTSGSIRLPDDERISVSLPAFGLHHLRNAASAAAVGYHLGMSAAQIEAGLKNWQCVYKRGRVLHLGQHRIVSDCFTANPASMRSALISFGHWIEAEGLVSVAVLGGMVGLGEQSEPLHVELGQQCVDLRIDHLIGVGAAMVGTCKLAERSGALRSVEHVPAKSIDHATFTLRELLDRSDEPMLILVKGSREYQLERVIRAICGSSVLL